MRKMLTRLALAGVAVTALAGAAVAQVPPPPPAPPAPPMAPLPPLPPLPPMEALMAMGPGMDMAGMDMAFMHHGRAADPEKRAQRLRDILQLRPDQDGALKAYLDATTMKIEIKRDVVIKGDLKDKGGDKSDKDRADKKEWVEHAPPTTLERLDHMSKAADMMKKRAEATRAFYLALTPAQQKTFDILGMGEGGQGGGDHVFIRRFDTKGPAVFKSGGGDGERRVIIQRKVG
jgi:hypothetical protein